MEDTPSCATTGLVSGGLLAGISTPTWQPWRNVRREKNVLASSNFGISTTLMELMMDRSLAVRTCTYVYAEFSEYYTVAKSLAAKSLREITCFVLRRTLNLNSIKQK